MGKSGSQHAYLTSSPNREDFRSYGNNTSRNGLSNFATSSSAGNAARGSSQNYSPAALVVAISLTHSGCTGINCKSSSQPLHSE